jgi:cellulose synthase/poly-beta-1,6-N-acetylglucosamine synthase-like glycosyltransferase
VKNAGSSGGRVQVSFISTVRDDAEGLGLLLDSLLAQSRLPDEVVLVDASPAPGCADTVRAFEEHAASRGVRTLFLARPGCTIAEGRNLATESARNEVIASSDAGCLLERSWLEELTSPFANRQVDAVAGSYRPLAESAWERATAAFLMPDPDRVSSRLPSARSLAYRKRAWKAAGGFPARLSHAEDTFFALCLRESGAVIEPAPRALVHWRPRPGPRGFVKQIYRYAKGDGTAGIFPGYYAKKMGIAGAGILLVCFLPAEPLLALPLAFLAGAALFLLWRRVPGHLRGALVFLLLLPVAGLHLAAQCTGYAAGLVRRMRGTDLHSGGGRRDA